MADVSVTHSNVGANNGWKRRRQACAANHIQSTASGALRRSSGAYARTANCAPSALAKGAVGRGCADPVSGLQCGGVGARCSCRSTICADRIWRGGSVYGWVTVRAPFLPTLLSAMKRPCQSSRTDKAPARTLINEPNACLPPLFVAPRERARLAARLLLPGRSAPRPVRYWCSCRADN